MAPGPSTLRPKGSRAHDARMSFELALGLWAVVTLFAWPAAVYLIAILAPDIADGWRATLRKRSAPWR